MDPLLEKVNTLIDKALSGDREAFRTLYYVVILMMSAVERRGGCNDRVEEL